MLKPIACFLALASLSHAPGFASAAAPPDLSGQPAFIRANPRLLERLDDLLAAMRSQSASPAAAPAAPSPCNANDTGTSVTFAWTLVPGAAGYHLFRDGNYYGQVGPTISSFQEFPGSGTHSYCVMAFNADGLSDPCCDTGAQTQVPGPSCSMSTSFTRNNFSWSFVPQAQAYRVYRDDQLLTQTTGLGILDFTSPGPHEYCVEATASGLDPSDRCCRPVNNVYPAVVTCNLQTNLNQNIFSWVAALPGLTYQVFRDNQLLATTTGANVVDVVSLGEHQYCVNPIVPDTDPIPCCRSTVNSFPPKTPKCTATSGQSLAIGFQWTSVSDVDHYEVTRDNASLGTFFPPETSLVDSVFGTHTYCVRAVNASGSSGQCCAVGSGVAVAAHTRLSWGSCTPQVPDQGFAGPGVYSLILSVREIPLTNVGHDSEIQIHPTVPDAWRFDDGGCQTSSALNAQVASQKGCPAMLGANSLKIVNYAIAPDGSATLRLAVVYDDLPTDPATRYALWRIDFDHASSIGGHDADDATCDGADLPLYFTSSTQVLLTNGHALLCGPETSDAIVTWNGSPVPARPLTWGRLKGMYR